MTDKEMARLLAWQASPAYEAAMRAREAPAALVAEHQATVAAALAAAQGATWRLVVSQRDGQAWQRPLGGAPFTVIWSLARENDEALWLHVSASHRQRIPTWDEMAMVKDLFVGAERWACQVHPPAAEHVNLHSRVLHLWAPWHPAAWTLPDFAFLTPDDTRTI